MISLLLSNQKDAGASGQEVMPHIGAEL